MDNRGAAFKKKGYPTFNLQKIKQPCSGAAVELISLAENIGHSRGKSR